MRLRSRVSGHWSNYESYLLKDENIHVGWMEWTSNKTFRLNKNPLTKHPQSPYTYIVPPDTKNPIQEGLIRVNPEKIVPQVNLPNGKTIGIYTKKFCIVDSYEPLDVNKLPRPYLNKDEFLYRLTNNWQGDVQKQFSKEIAVNILSCPKSEYGIGGIGAQSLSPYGGKKELKSLNISIQNLLPKDFLRKNKRYIYKPIKTVKDLNSANSYITRNTSEEVSYNYLFTTSPETQKQLIPTQVPLIIPEAIYKPDKWELDRDILDYQLSSLLLNPYIEESAHKHLNNIVTKTAQDILRKSSIQAPLDNTGVLRLAKAWCRLEYKQSINEEDFSRMKNDFQDIFKEYFDMIEDANKTGRTYNVPLTRFDSNRLSVEANKMFKYFNKISREQGKKRITKDILRKEIPKGDIADYFFDSGLQELVNSGLLLMFKNYTEFELMDL